MADPKLESRRQARRIVRRVLLERAAAGCVHSRAELDARRQRDAEQLVAAGRAIGVAIRTAWDQVVTFRDAVIAATEVSAIREPGCWRTAHVESDGWPGECGAPADGPSGLCRRHADELRQAPA